eukprot:6369702-Amphidinium_carterae.1
MSQRRSQRQEQLEADLRKREEQECTFAPKIYTKAAPHSARGAPSDVESAVYKDRVRERKLKKIEDQAYKELTLRPVISDYAQAKRQQETTADGSQIPTVFDRLYRAAQAREDRRMQLLEGFDLEKVQQTSRPSQGRKESSGRRIPAGDL